MANNKQYELNAPVCVMEVIDGETVIINSEKGYYYNLLNQSTLILESMLEGYSPKEISVENDFDSKSIQALNAFIAQCLEHDIIIERAHKIKYKMPINHIEIKVPEKEIFIDVYTDMSDILLLDPIHEADEVLGWPNKIDA